MAKAVLGIENGMFSHGASPVFENVSFMLDAARTGLVGQNGTGKTTLLKCLMGELTLNTGRVVRSRSLHISYLPQDVPGALLNLSVRAVLAHSLSRANSRDDWKIDMLLDALKVAEADAERSLASFSGGVNRLR